MFARPLPTSAGVASSRDEQLNDEPFARVRSQTAVVRALAHHAERYRCTEEADGLSEQLREEMERLGLLESAVSVAMLPLPEESRTRLRDSVDVGRL